MVARIAGFLFRGAALWALLGAGLAVGAYEVLKPTDPGLTDRQHALVEELADRATAWLRQRPPLREPTAFLTLGRDRFGTVSDRLRTVLWQSDRFELLDDPAREKLARKIDWTRPTADSRAEAVERAEARGCPYVLWGTVREFSDLRRVARLAVDLELVRTDSQRVVDTQTFDIRRGKGAALSSPAEAAPTQVSRGGWTLPARLLVWVGATLALPLVTYPLARRVLLADRHAATLALLVGYVAASVVVAYGVVLRGAGGWLGGAVLLGAFALALVYDWRALSTIKAVNE
ncbi:MAG: hypothetical protein ACODAJ_10145 [Planctomycetota bacterium]